MVVRDSWSRAELAIMILLVTSGVFRIGGVALSVNTMLSAGAMVLVGYQILLAGTFTRALGAVLGSHPRSAFLDRWSQRLPMEFGVAAGTVLMLLGLGLLSHAAWAWGQTGFGQMGPELSIRQVIPAVILISVGVQTVFGSFLLSLLSYVRRS
jgi:hypothetical protein